MNMPSSTRHGFACRYSGQTFNEVPRSMDDCCCDPTGRNQPEPGDLIIHQFYDGQPMIWRRPTDPQWMRATRKGKMHIPTRQAHHNGYGAACSQAFMILDPDLPVGDEYALCRSCERIRPNLQGEKMPTVPTRAERLAAQVARLQAEIDRLALMPDEPAPDENGDGPVIFFEKTFGTARRYTYAAVKAGDGLWYTTGPKSPGGYTWQNLIEWILDDGDKDTQVWVATAWETLT